MTDNTTENIITSQTLAQNEKFRIWTETKRNSTEGHIFDYTLSFENKVVWGPRGCHDNTTELQNAIRAADPRFHLELRRREKTVEGHTRFISVSSNGQLILDKLSTHDNMDGMVAVINAILVISPTP